jgi:hypothetical protein
MGKVFYESCGCQADISGRKVRFCSECEREALRDIAAAERLAEDEQARSRAIREQQRREAEDS